MKILVTGGAGFIGSWLVEDLLNHGHEIKVIDNLSTQIHGALPQPDAPWLTSENSVEFIRADIRDMKAMDQALDGVNAVVHLAAETGTGQSMYQIARYYDVNQQATALLLEAIATRHRQVERVVLASSRSVYGEGAYELEGELYTPGPRDPNRLKRGLFDPIGPKGEPLRLLATPETAAPYPASVYAATKLANETLGRVFSEAYGTRVVALRFQNVYGERQSLRNPYTGILSIFSNRMRQNLSINIFEDGHESRDFIHVSDVSRAITLSLKASLPAFSLINIGSGIATSVIEVAGLLCQELGSGSKLEVSGDFRSGDIRHCYADQDRARSLLSFAPEVEIAEGIRRFCDWVRTQAILQDRSVQAMTELTQLGLGNTKAKL